MSSSWPTRSPGSPTRTARSPAPPAKRDHSGAIRRRRRSSSPRFASAPVRGWKARGTSRRCSAVSSQVRTWTSRWADILRGVLDGHVVLDREIAERGRFPAIDVLKSVSRSLPRAATEAENALIGRARQGLGAHEKAALMISRGFTAPAAIRRSTPRSKPGRTSTPSSHGASPERSRTASRPWPPACKARRPDAGAGQPVTREATASASIAEGSGRRTPPSATGRSPPVRSARERAGSALFARRARQTSAGFRVRQVPGTFP